MLAGQGCVVCDLSEQNTKAQLGKKEPRVQHSSPVGQSCFCPGSQCCSGWQMRELWARGRSSLSAPVGLDESIFHCFPEAGCSGPGDWALLTLGQH